MTDMQSLVGQTLGQYRITEQIGQGGMSPEQANRLGDLLHAMDDVHESTSNFQLNA